MNTLTALEAIPLFSELDQLALQALERGSVRRSYKKNRILIDEGDASDSLYVVHSGLLHVYLANEDGREVILNSLGAGDYFGELALIDEEPRSASVAVVEDCELSVISRELFERVVTEQPGVNRALMIGLVKRIRALSNTVSDLVLVDVHGRICHLITELAEQDHDGVMVTPRIRHQDIASRIGASREMVTRILKDLREEGAIEIVEKRIRILKPLSTPR